MVLEYAPIIIMSGIGLAIGILWGRAKKRDKARHGKMERDRNRKR